MRLAPIDRPSSWLGRIMSWGMKHQLGKVITPARVVYNRVPRAWNITWAILRLETSGRKLDHALWLLVQTRAAMQNGCEFCQDIARARAVQERLGMERFNALADYETDPVFEERERAALAYADEITRDRKVSDATFARLREHFDDREVVEITLANAIENYFNCLNIPFQVPDDGLEALAAERAG